MSAYWDLLPYRIDFKYETDHVGQDVSFFEISKHSLKEFSFEQKSSQLFWKECSIGGDYKEGE